MPADPSDQKCLRGAMRGTIWQRMTPRPKSTNAKVCECALTCFAPTSLWCVAIVDAEDAWLLQRWKWSATTSGRDHVFYAKSMRYRRETGKSDRLHQAVTGHIHPQLDHRNGNGHDNRKANLRPCTYAESARNRGKQAFGSVVERSSKYKGICKFHDRNWRARIKLDGRSIHLGCFGFEADAAIAYNYQSAHLFGEFAGLNDLNDIVYMHD
jgi:hypothetical protein